MLQNKQVFPCTPVEGFPPALEGGLVKEAKQGHTALATQLSEVSPCPQTAQQASSCSAPSVALNDFGFPLLCLQQNDVVFLLATDRYKVDTFMVQLD